MKQFEQIAGEAYVEMRQEIMNGLFKTDMLARHILIMTKPNENGIKPYQVRHVPPDYRPYRIDSFKDYLLKPAREGLGFSNLRQVDTFIRAIETVGAKGSLRDNALTRLREEIPDYDEEVTKTAVKETADKDEKNQRPRGGNNNPEGLGGKSGKAIVNDNNVIIDKERDSPVGNSREKGLRELRQKAPELHAKVLAGELTVNAACVQAGFRKRKAQVPLDDPYKAVAILLKHFTIEQLQEAILQKSTDS